MSARADEDAEFDLLMRAAGLEVPPDRRSGTLSVHRELRRMASMLRQPREAADEPAQVFDLEAVLRGPT